MNSCRHNDIVNARISAAKNGLNGQIGSQQIHKLALHLIEIAEVGLKNRAKFNKQGEDETIFLRPLKIIVDSGLTQADIVRNLYYNEWGQEINKVFEHYRY